MPLTMAISLSSINPVFSFVLRNWNAVCEARLPALVQCSYLQEERESWQVATARTSRECWTQIH